LGRVGQTPYLRRHAPTPFYADGARFSERWALSTTDVSANSLTISFSTILGEALMSLEKFLEWYDGAVSWMLVAWVFFAVAWMVVTSIISVLGLIQAVFWA